MKIFEIYFILSLSSQIQFILAGKEKLEASLLKKVETNPGGKWDIFVDFTVLPTPSGPFTVETRNTFISHADKTQAEVRKKLKDFRSIWLSNSLATKAASRELILSISEDPNVIGIEEDEELKGPPPTTVRSGPTSGPASQTQSQGPSGQLDPKLWGVERIGAPAWHKAGYTGEGVIVGIIDMGFDGNHPEIKDSWLGYEEGGWLYTRDRNSKFPDTIPDYPFSESTRNFGTSMTGLIAGKTIGVAPGVKWIACDGHDYYNARDYVECLAFMLCPNPQGGCSNRPDIVSCSWGYGSFGYNVTDPFGRWNRYDNGIQMLRNSGVIPVFTIGYSIGDPGCNSAANPGYLENVLAIGTTDKSEFVEYSNLGPPLQRYPMDVIEARGIYKPEFVAPGVDIYTIYRPDKYAVTGGVLYPPSFASGAIALLLSRTEGMTYQKVKDILIKSAYTGNLTHRDPNASCGNISDSTFPNHKFGWGRIQLPDPNSDWLPPVKKPGPRTTPTPPGVGSRPYAEKSLILQILVAANLVGGILLILQ